MKRMFPILAERVEGKPQSVARLNCGKCGVSGSLPLSHRLPMEAIEQKFTRKGWIVGDSPKYDLCPACALKIKERPNLKIVAKEPEPQPTERVMQREDRRIIFEKLNETYINEKTGYDAGWSDHRVATELGCPRKWVETVREEMFGSIGTSPEMAEFLSEAESLIADARKILGDCQKTRDEVRKMVDQITAMLSGPDQKAVIQISDRLGAVERLAEKVKKLVV
jgi:hypothetical protein